jgi:hypothetical protein
VPTTVAFVDVPAKGRGAALLEGRHGLELRAAQIVLGAVVGTVLTKDVADLEPNFRRVWRKFSGDLVLVAAACLHATEV